jgi:transposase InsO family protein
MVKLAFTYSAFPPIAHRNIGGQRARRSAWWRALSAATLTHRRSAVPTCRRAGQCSASSSRRPQTNGKVERFNRTLLEEWAYVRPYTSNQRRTQALTTWPHIYNHHRAHTSLGQLPPISRVNNVAGHYI